MLQTLFPFLVKLHVIAFQSSNLVDIVNNRVAFNKGAVLVRCQPMCTFYHGSDPHSNINCIMKAKLSKKKLMNENVDSRFRTLM